MKVITKHHNMKQQINKHNVSYNISKSTEHWIFNLANMVFISPNWHTWLIINLCHMLSYV